MLRAQVLRKGSHPRQPGLNEGRFTKLTAADYHLTGHPAGFRAEIPRAVPHHLLRERKDHDLQFQQVHYRIVILEPVHPANGRGRKSLLRTRTGMKQLAQFQHQLLAHPGLEFGFFLRRHLMFIDDVNYRLQTFKIGNQVRSPLNPE